VRPNLIALSLLFRHSTCLGILVIKPIADFDKYLPRVIPVETTEGLAVVEVHAPIGDVQSVHRCRKALPEVLAERQIERSVSRQVVSRIRLIWERGAKVIYDLLLYKSFRQLKAPEEVNRQERTTRSQTGAS
jgi:hypothetical protein